MNDDQVRDEIFNVVWKACDTFRGVIDPAQYKDYILTIICEVSVRHPQVSVCRIRKEIRATRRVSRAMERERCDSGGPDSGRQG